MGCSDVEATRREVRRARVEEDLGEKGIVSAEKLGWKRLAGGEGLGLAWGVGG